MTVIMGSPAFAQTGSAQTSANAEAVIVTPLSFIKDEDLDFGTILTGTTNGTVVVSPFNIRSRTGNATTGPQLVPSASQAARFAGRGTQNQLVQISMGANSYSVPRVGGGAPALTLDTFIIGSTPTAQLTTNPRVFRISSASGVFNFPVGATLRIAGNQRPGTYVTQFLITLNYQ